MKVYFLILEFFTLFFMAYVVIKKGEISVIYLLVYYFSTTVSYSIFPASIGYMITTLMLGFYFFKNLPFVYKNIFTVIISIYFVILLAYNIKDFTSVRPYLFGTLSLFFLIGIVPEIYSKYNKKQLLKELGFACFLVLLIFCSNSLFSTIFNFNPHLMYGISSGVLYGNLIHSDFHILPLVVYIVLKVAIQEKKLGYAVLYMISMFLILLTFRRTVMVLSIIGSLIVIIELVSFENIKKLTLVVMLFIVTGLVVIQQTGFLNTFWERYELRKLDNRDFEGELRVLELGLVYKDLFVYYDYSPWIGYGLFQYNGRNYGKGALGTRPLHTDPMVLIHTSGIIGLMLYLLMVSYAFVIAWQKTKNRSDFIQFIYIVLVFTVFFFTGRFTNTGSSLIVYLVLFLSLGTEKSIGSKLKIQQQKNKFI